MQYNGRRFEGEAVGAVQKLKYWVLLILMRALALLPWRLLAVLGAGVGVLLWRLHTRARQVTELNLAHCLPELNAAERERLARASLRDFGRTALEIAKVWFTPPARVLDAVAAVEGEELLRNALAEGRGVILLAPHLGNWEVLGLFLGHHYGVTSMYLPAKDPALDALVRTARGRNGAALVPASSGGVRSLIKALKQGRLTGVLPDQVPKQAGADFAPFFGRPALTMTLASNLLQKTGARAVFAYACRLRRGRGFRIVFRAVDPDLYSADPALALAALNSGVEACARDCLEQYQWEYKRFKVQPPGCAELY